MIKGVVLEKVNIPILLRWVDLRDMRSGDRIKQSRLGMLSLEGCL